MLEIIGIFVFIAIFVVLFGALVAMAVFPMVRHPSEPVGPWDVKIGDDFLILHSPDCWDTTSIQEHAAIFESHAEAEEWARYVGGVVVQGSTK